MTAHDTAPAHVAPEPVHSAAAHHGELVGEGHDSAAADSPLNLSLFADAYYNADFNQPPAMDANGAPRHRAFVRTNGFALSFLGVDATYDSGNVGMVANLRFGPSACRLIGHCNAASLNLGQQFIKQAYVTYKPNDQVTLDFGQFDTIYGAEVADSFENLNYTRGALYYLMQPYWHQGLRLGFAPNEQVSVTALVVNGVNQQFDADRGPDLGLQLGFTQDEAFFGAVGYYGSTQPNGKKWAHFVDLVLSGSADIVNVVFNGSLGVADNLFSSAATGNINNTSIFYGASLAARVQANESFAVAARGEYLAEPNRNNSIYQVTEFWGGNLLTGTLTFEYVPADAQNIIFRLDGRFERSTNLLFYNGNTNNPPLWSLRIPQLSQVPILGLPNSRNYASAVLGVVVKTN